MSGDADFEQVVDLYYPVLFRFAFSLTGQETDAADLTQQTFYIWAKKRGQIKDATKVKSWLFTTLHREFLQTLGRAKHFPEVGLEHSEMELPTVAPQTLTRADSNAIVEAMTKLDPVFKSAVTLFYLEDYSYIEIAEVLQTPLGTVKSRISRGIAQLQKLLETREVAGKEARQ